MKVILQKDVKDLGKTGDLVRVATGYARNFLFPRKLAAEASQNRVKFWNHLQKVAEIKKKKAVDIRKQLLQTLEGVSVEFKLAAGENNKLFGSVTSLDVSKALEKKGYSVDKRDIHIEPIKVLGQHKAEVKLGENLTSEITVVVDRA